MIRWAAVSFVVTAISLGLLPAKDVSAGEPQEPFVQLLSDSRKLDAATLDAQSARGLADDSIGLKGQLNEFGVILWDELKPARPAGPSPNPAPGGQGGNSVNSASR